MRPFFSPVKLLLLFLLTGITSVLEAQKQDTLHTTKEFITNQLEDLTRRIDRQQDYSDLTGDYLYYAQHPINLNGENVEELLKLRLLNAIQLASLKNYIHQYGIIYSLYELRYIPGWDKRTIERLMPFVRTGKPAIAPKFSWKKALHYGSHQLLLRYGQMLEKAEGYKIPHDSAYLKPGSVFLGTPQKLYLRYAFRADNHLRFGFTAEKDAGEVLFPSRLNDSVLKMLAGKKPGFPDFFSAYLYVGSWGIIKKFVVGDYHLEFGQGLCLWSGLSFGKSVETTNINYYGTGIRPNTSANENRFFRGTAVTLATKGLSLTVFYSHNKADGTLIFSPQQKEELSTLIETGNHRTINELRSKNSVTIDAFGGHFSYTRGVWKTGVTFYQTRLSLPLKPVSELYRLKKFKDSQWNNASINMSLQLYKAFLFGELATNPGGVRAGIAGVNFYPADRLFVTLSYRNYSPSYQVLFASPFTESGNANNEEGFYFGTNILLSKQFTFSAYADYFNFPRLKFQVNAPSVGKAFAAQLNMQATSNLNMYFRVRYTQREENYSSPDFYTPVLVNKKLSDFRYALTYQPNAWLTLKSRLEFVKYTKHTEHQTGFLVYQDFIYRFNKIPFMLNFRYALFDTDGWDSRIYAYESDVLYAFTIPPYYNKGQRIYLLMHYKLNKHLEAWIKVSRTSFFNKKHISSGAEMLDTHHKTSVKAQLQIKF